MINHTHTFMKATYALKQLFTCAGAAAFAGYESTGKWDRRWVFSNLYRSFSRDGGPFDEKDEGDLRIAYCRGLVAALTCAEMVESVAKGGEEKK